MASPTPNVLNPHLLQSGIATENTAALEPGGMFDSEVGMVSMGREEQKEKGCWSFVVRIPSK